MARKNPDTYQFLQNDLAATKLAIEKAKLAKLQESLPKLEPNYTRYEDIPAPSPEERERFKQRLALMIDTMERRAAQEKRAWYLSMTDFAP